MKNLTKSIALLLCAGICHSAAQADTYISETKYDWSGLATSITSASKSNYEKAHDIYAWLTDNIAYDTSYAIHDADGTYENKKGVCQGYCELFYRVAQCVDLKCDIIFGKSKDNKGYIDPIGHAWLFVYTEGNSGILVDPTWGAGSVNNGVFERNQNETWFNVDPQWMIFTHFPDDEMYQLIDRKIDFNTFALLPSFEPSLGKYGYNGTEFLQKSISGSAPAIPKWYSNVIDRHTRGVQFPKEQTLHVGTSYDFFVAPQGDSRFVINNGDYKLDEWVDAGDYKGMRFMPSEAGKLNVGVYNPNGSWTFLVEYDVPSPTAAEIANLESAFPMLSPSLTKLGNYNRRIFEELGVDGHKLLKAVKSENISELPVLYPQTGCRPIDVPWNNYLKAGQSYTFVLTPGQGKAFAAKNSDNWQLEWATDPATGNIIITIPEATPGPLTIMADTDGSNSYLGILQYTVR